MGILFSSISYRHKWAFYFHPFLSRPFQICRSALNTKDIIGSGYHKSIVSKNGLINNT